jgi:hypothetical protein
VTVGTGTIIVTAGCVTMMHCLIQACAFADRTHPPRFSTLNKQRFQEPKIAAMNPHSSGLFSLIENQPDYLIFVVTLRLIGYVIEMGYTTFSEVADE